MKFFKRHETFTAVLAALVAFSVIFSGLYVLAQTPMPARSNPAILYKSDGTEVSYLSTVAHDASASAVNPLLAGCYSSAAAPTDVTADTEAVRAWCLRNGARAIQPTFAGVLWSTGNGVAGTGTPRVTIASDNTAFGVNAAQSGTWNLNNISGTISLPTGAATSALQDGIVKDGTGDTTQANVSSGRLHVDGSGVTQPVSGTVTSNQGGSNWSVNVAQINGVATTMGNGVSGTGVQRVTIASDSTGQVALAAGSATVGNVRQVPITSGGLSSCVLQSAASTNATNCKASAGQLYNIQVINTTSTIYYLRLYNSSGAPTCSSATGFIRSIPIPHASGNGAGIAVNQHPGEAFGTGIGFCFTGGGSSTDNTNAATGVYITLLYK